MSFSDPSGLLGSSPTSTPLNPGADQGLRWWQIDGLLGNRGPDDGSLGQRKPKKGKEVMGPPLPPRGNRGEKIVTPPIILEPPGAYRGEIVEVPEVTVEPSEGSGAGVVIATTMAINGALLADDVTIIGVGDDILIPVVTVVGCGIAAYLLISHALSESEPESVGSLLDGLPGKTGKTGPIKEVPDEKALDDLFDALSSGGTTVNPGTYPGVVKELPDGTIIRRRPGSKSGGATLDITMPDGTIIKVHIK